MLLTRLQGHAQSKVALGIHANADDTSGENALVGLARREEAGMWSAVTERHAKTLCRTNGYIGTPFARRRQVRKGHEVRADRYQSAPCMSTLAEFRVVAHRAIAGRVLNVCTEDRPVK